MYAIIAAVRDCGFFGVDLRAIQPLKRSTYTGTYTETADKDFKDLSGLEQKK